VGAASNGDRIREPNGGPMLPEELRPAPSECVYSGLTSSVVVVTWY
jgi:hypothetical protein